MGDEGKRPESAHTHTHTPTCHLTPLLLQEHVGCVDVSLQRRKPSEHRRRIVFRVGCRLENVSVRNQTAELLFQGPDTPADGENTVITTLISFVGHFSKTKLENQIRSGPEAVVQSEQQNLFLAWPRFSSGRRIRTRHPSNQTLQEEWRENDDVRPNLGWLEETELCRGD